MRIFAPLAFLALAYAAFQPSGVPFKSPVTVAPGLSARVIFSNLTLPRGIAIDPAGHILAVERGLGITGFTEVAGGWQRDVIIADTAFTHGIAIDGNKIYVSTASEVKTYIYNAVTKAVSGTPTVVVTGFPADGGMSCYPSYFYSLTASYRASDSPPPYRVCR